MQTSHPNNEDDLETRASNDFKGQSSTRRLYEYCCGMYTSTGIALIIYGTVHLMPYQQPNIHENLVGTSGIYAGVTDNTREKKAASLIFLASALPDLINGIIYNDKQSGNLAASKAIYFILNMIMGRGIKFVYNEVKDALK